MKILKIIDFLCDDCETPLGHYMGFPYVEVGDYTYCYDCALKRGLITPMAWFKASGMEPDHATFKDGVVTGFWKWGRGFRKCTCTIGKDGADVEL